MKALNLVMICNRNVSEKAYVCVCVYRYLNRFAVHLKLTSHCKPVILQ